jgi:beta-lactam-binding protein with PASTA domain
MLRLCLAFVVVLGSCSACANREPRVPTEQLQPVPDVVGATVADARDALEAAGFIVDVVSASTAAGMPTPCPKAKVVAQDPAPDSDVRRATTVTLTARRC